jgi:hypothetical protein
MGALKPAKFFTVRAVGQTLLKLLLMTARIRAWIWLTCGLEQANWPSTAVSG